MIKYIQLSHKIPNYNISNLTWHTIYLNATNIYC